MLLEIMLCNKAYLAKSPRNMLTKLVRCKNPPPNKVRSFVDNGEGPPDLRKGCLVLRGIDWKYGDKYGKELPPKKAPEPEKIVASTTDSVEPPSKTSDPNKTVRTDKDADDMPVSPDTLESACDNPVDDPVKVTPAKEKPVEDTPTGLKSSRRKKKKQQKPKLPYGTVLSVEPWDEVPTLGSLVCCHATGVEKVYRYGGDRSF